MPPRDEAAAEPPKQVPSRLERWMGEEDRRSRDPAARSIPRIVVGLAVATLSLGLAMLAIVSKLDLNDVEDVPPRMALSSDGAEGEVQVLQAEPGLRWSDLQLDGDCSPLLNGAPLSETPTAAIRAGDVLSCESGETLRINSTRERGDATLHETRFA